MLTPEEEGREEGHPVGDLPERLQDVGEQMEERPEEEIPPRTSPPQVPPKLLHQLSPGDGKCYEVKNKSFVYQMNRRGCVMING